jgi:predicted Zn-dependent protease with MMP-like domain
LKKQRFQELVALAIDLLPENFRKKLENVDIIAEARPPGALMEEMGLAPGGTLLGLYRGIPLKERNSGYSAVLPDLITIYQEPIEALCRSEAEIKNRITEVLAHEIGHHFGMSEEDMP